MKSQQSSRDFLYVLQGCVGAKCPYRNTLLSLLSILQHTHNRSRAPAQLSHKQNALEGSCPKGKALSRADTCSGVLVNKPQEKQNSSTCKAFEGYHLNIKTVTWDKRRLSSFVPHLGAAAATLPPVPPNGTCGQQGQEVPPAACQTWQQPQRAQHPQLLPKIYFKSLLASFVHSGNLYKPGIIWSKTKFSFSVILGKTP